MRLLTGSARIAGIVGWPVAHSRSPRLHGTWIERYGIDGAYIPLAVPPSDFPAVIRGLAKAGFAGVNITIPHKETCFAWCDRLEPCAVRAGAVNTLVFDNGITGRNTDGYGFIENLRAHGVNPAAGPVLLLGAGGSARSIAAALQDVGAPVTFCNRSADRAAALAAALPPAATLPWDQRAAALADYALLVNTTSLGMVGQPPLDILLDRAPPGLVVSDIVYAPLETPLLAAARANGMLTVGGLGMLLHQAVPGFTAWFGVKPAVDEDLYRIVAS